jgi:hypothetical protein
MPTPRAGGERLSERGGVAPSILERAEGGGLFHRLRHSTGRGRSGSGRRAGSSPAQNSCDKRGPSVPDSRDFRAAAVAVDHDAGTLQVQARIVDRCGHIPSEREVPAPVARFLCVGADAPFRVKTAGSRPVGILLAPLPGSCPAGCAPASKKEFAHSIPGTSHSDPLHRARIRRRGRRR